MNLRSPSGLLAGVLAFIGVYEFSAALGVPFAFTVDRVTSYYVVREPLLGSLALDYLAVAAATMTLYFRWEGRDSRLLFFLALAPIFSGAGFLLGAPEIAFFGVSLSAFCPAGFYLARVWPEASDFKLGLILCIVGLEVGALASAASYYALGGWSPPALSVVFRERVFWSILEWVAVPLFIGYTWYSLLKILRGEVRRFPRMGGDGRGLLFVAMALAWILVLLPHLPTVNPGFKPVSVDTYYYTGYLYAAAEEGPLEALGRAHMGRPVYLLALYASWEALGRNTVLLLDVLHPLLALTLLALASYYAASRLYDGEAGGYAALLAVGGVAGVSFVAGGFQANSIALSIALITLTVDPSRPGGSARLLTLLTLLSLVHPWTFLMYSAGLVLYWALKSPRLGLRVGSSVFLAYLASQLVDYALSAFIVGEVALRPVAAGLGLHAPNSWFEAFELWTWNTLSNPLLYILALPSPGPTLAHSVMAAAAPLTPFTPPTIIYRLILNMPVHIVAAITLKKLNPTLSKPITIAIIARTITTLTGLTPLTTPPWTLIYQKPL